MKTRNKFAIAATLAAGMLSGLPLAQGEAPVLNIVGGEYRPDAPFPEFAPLWREGWSWKDENGDRVRYAYEGMPLGGYVFATFLNTGKEPITAKDVLLEGVSLAQGVAFESEPKVVGVDQSPASVRYSKLPKEQIDRLMKAGEPVWWKVQPTPIAPGAMGQVTIRLRRDPQVESLKIAVPGADGQTQEATFHVRKRQPRFFSINFSPKLDRAQAYLRHPSGKGVAPVRVLLDGADITNRCTVAADEAVDTVSVAIRLEKPLKEASYHVFQADYPDGLVARSGIGAWSTEMVYGMWGCTLRGGTPEETATGYIEDLAAHNVNVFMSHCGGRVMDHLRSPEGKKLLESHGIRQMLDWIDADRKPVFYFLKDEPDAADFATKSLEPQYRLGSLGQFLVDRCKMIHRKDPHDRPILLNVDNTFKPENWYMYAQLADIPCADPYYQEAVQSVWGADPTNMGAYLKPTYVYAVGSIYQSAGAPLPMHLILHTCRFDFEAEEFPYRAPTPEEKRVELYYALAAGAKQISFWWYSPDTRYYGVGGDAPEMKALWREIGLVGGEIRTIGDLVTQGCPANLPTKGPRMLWVRSLIAGADTVVVLVVNDNMASDRLGTVVKPVEQAKLTVRMPAWLRLADGFEMSCEGTKDLAYKAGEGGVAIDLGKVDLTRMVILTADAKLRQRLQATFDKHFAANAKALRAQPAK